MAEVKDTAKVTFWREVNTHLVLEGLDAALFGEIEDVWRIHERRRREANIRQFTSLDAAVYIRDDRAKRAQPETDPKQRAADQTREDWLKPLRNAPGRDALGHPNPPQPERPDIPGSQWPAEDDNGD